MGKFFNTLHVKTVKKETFIECFEWIMKKEGFVPCDKDEAEVSFAAAFSEGGWVSLSNGDDSADGLSKLSERLAKDLFLPNFTVEAVDSDFAIIELRVPDKKTKFRKSRLVVGEGEGYGVEKAPIFLDDWRPLFQNGGVEEFLAAAGQDGVFVEDALCELGKILGIKPAVMAWCYDEFEEKIGRGDVISLAFKKKAEKKLTLNAAFKQVFGEALEPLGYRLIKGKYPYFVRVVSDEIIHYVTVANERADGRGWDGVIYKCFKVYCGVATVYNGGIDFDENHFKYSSDDFIDGIGRIYSITHRYDHDANYCASISAFYYNPTGTEKMIEALDRALKATEEIAMPVINQAVTLEKCMDYFELMNHDLYLFLESGGEGLLCTKLFSADEYVMFCGRSSEREITQCRYELDSNLNLDPKRRASLEERIEYIMSRREEGKKKCYESFTNPELQEKAPAELERRRKENTEKLRSYGLEI